MRTGLRRGPRRTYKIRYLLITSISVLVVLITLSVGAVTFAGIRSIFANNMFGYIDETTSKTMEGIDKFLQEIDTLILYVFQDREICEELTRTSEGEDISHARRLLIEDRLNSYKMPFLNRYKSIWLSTNRPNLSIGVNETANSFNPETYGTLMEQFVAESRESVFGRTVWTGIYDIETNKDIASGDFVYGDKITNKSIFALKTIKNLDTFKSIGTLVVEVEGSLLKSIVENSISIENDGVILMEPTGKIIFSSNPALTEQSFVEQVGGENYRSIIGSKSGHRIVNGKVYSYSDSDYSNWKLVSIFPLDNIDRDISKTQRIILLVSVIGVLMGIFISVLISLQIERPIKKLVRKMEKVNMEQLDAPMEINTNVGEIAFLNRGMMDMFERIKQLIRDIILRQEKEKELEIKVLQLQINPHFLYNTLDTLQWHMVMKGQEEIAGGVLALSNLLRYSISGGNGIATVEAELKQLENYLSIQQLRFGNRFTVNIAVEKEIMKNSIPKLTLQPIVENAINHGLKGKNNYGRLEIFGRREGEEILLTVKDDGIGIREEDLKKIRDREYTSGGTGLGIKNVSDRIALQLGRADAISIESSYGTGTTVYIRLPKNERSDLSNGQSENSDR